jgi:pimeloyl-ACP methyl ester carboxylesterase
VRFLSRWFRCITFNARGYPPSDVPEDPARYSQTRARDDIRDVLAHLGIERAHIVGLSIALSGNRASTQIPRLSASGRGRQPPDLVRSR